MGYRCTRYLNQLKTIQEDKITKMLRLTICIRMRFNYILNHLIKICFVYLDLNIMLGSYIVILQVTFEHLIVTTTKLLCVILIISETAYIILFYTLFVEWDDN